MGLSRLREIYYNPSNPASFSSAERLHKQLQRTGSSLSLDKIKNWLSGQNTYTLHKQAYVNFRRNPIIVEHIDEQWQADLVDLQDFSRKNAGNKYILTVIDIFSKYAWAVPIKNKTAKSVVEAFVKIFRQRIPIKLQTDQGKEFVNHTFTQFLNKHGIDFFTSKNKRIKCSVVERFNRSLKSKMFKYFTAKGTRKYVDVLDDFLTSYNNRIQRSIGMRPSGVRKEDEAKIFQRLYGVRSMRELLFKRSKTKFNVGDKVRIQYPKDPLQKGYYPGWTDQIFKIQKVLPQSKQSMFRLINDEDVELPSRFYNRELQKVINPTYRIEKIIRTRKKGNIKEYFVKWLNHPSSYNSWIKESDLV